MDTLLANLIVSVTELKRHYSDILKQVDDGPVAYLLSAAHYKRLINHLEDLGDAQLVRERSEGPFVDVTLADF